MNLIDFLLNRKPEEDVFDEAAFLSHWYFDKYKPKLSIKSHLLIWEYIENVESQYVGALLLKDRNGVVLGLVNSYIYIKSDESGSKFLVWKRTLENNQVQIHLYETKDLKEIENSEELLLKFKETKANPYYFNCKPAATLTLNLNPSTLENEVECSEDFKDFDEILMLMDIPNLYGEKEENLNNTAIVVLTPKLGTFLIYPQDWFNKSNADFGYQWITRAIRDYKTGLIKIQGMRIDSFTLDKTNRNLKSSGANTAQP